MRYLILCSVPLLALVLLVDSATCSRNMVGHLRRENVGVSPLAMEKRERPSAERIARSTTPRLVAKRGGVARPAPAVPTNVNVTCSAFLQCWACTESPGCGWCGTTNQCMLLDSSSSLGSAACPWHMWTDCCTVSATCQNCLKQSQYGHNCTWCQQLGCFPVTSSTPSTWSCANDWEYHKCQEQPNKEPLVSADSLVLGLVLVVGSCVLLLGLTAVGILLLHRLRQRVAQDAVISHMRERARRKHRVCQHCQEETATLRCTRCESPLMCASCSAVRHELVRHEVTPLEMNNRDGERRRAAAHAAATVAASSSSAPAVSTASAALPGHPGPDDEKQSLLSQTSFTSLASLMKAQALPPSSPNPRGQLPTRSGGPSGMASPAPRRNRPTVSGSAAPSAAAAAPGDAALAVPAPYGSVGYGSVNYGPSGV